MKTLGSRKQYPGIRKILSKDELKNTFGQMEDVALCVAEQECSDGNPIGCECYVPGSCRATGGAVNCTCGAATITISCGTGGASDSGGANGVK